MAKPQAITLADGTIIPILYEDRSVLAIDKPAGWLLAPASWDQTARNLQLALESSIQAGDFWARSRNLKFLRFVHRLDADTGGVLLLAKSRGALRACSELFEARRVEKLYLAVVHGIPKQAQWTCRQAIADDPDVRGKMRAASPAPPRATAAAHAARGTSQSVLKPAVTDFRVLKTSPNTALVAAHPTTGRTHQIRVHLAASGHPVLGDVLYGQETPSPTAGPTPSGPKPSSVRMPRERRLAGPEGMALALRAIALSYRNPFTGKPARIEAPFVEFVGAHGFKITRDELFPRAKRHNLW